jgi:glycosyltransferase involved in cell wall biosynthesis
VHALGRVRGHPFSALIVGDGPERQEIESAVHALGLETAVRLCGPRRDIPDLLARCDVFALSSRSEGGPISVLEAMAAGLPVVASDVGGVGEIVVDQQTGLLVPPGDPDALAAALERLLADPALRHRLGAAGRERAAQRFSLGALRAAHLELYARELARHGAPSLMP